MDNMYSENEIRFGVKKEDEKILAQLYAEVYPKVEQMLLKNGGKTDDAKDIFQEAFVVLIENLRENKFKGDSKVSTYLFSISKYKWYNLNKKNKNVSLDLMKESKNWEASEEIIESSYDEKTLTKLKVAMSELSEECRKLLVENYYLNKDMKELAEAMDYSYAFIRVKKNRCMNTLKKKLNS